VSFQQGPLSEIADVLSGYAFKSSWFGDGADKIVRIGDLQDGLIQLDEAKTFESSKHNVSDQFKIREGDILMALSGATTGKIALATEKDEGAYLNQRVAIVRGKNKTHSEYLRHVLGGSLIDELLLLAGGAAQPNLSPKNLANFVIPLPPLEEQKRIAAILDKADAIRRKRQQAIELADQFLRSVFLDMFGDPVMNPKGWSVDQLSDCIKHANNGLSRRRKEGENTGDIVLRLQDVQYEGIQFDKELNRIALDEKEKPRYKLDDNDLVFIRVNGNPDYVGRSAVFKGYRENVYHNDHLIRIKFSDVYNSEFLSYVLNYPGSRVIIKEQLKTSAGQHTISQSGIEKLSFYRPPKDLQDKFVRIKNRVKEVHYDLQKINDLFGALSQQAFKGGLTQSEAA